MGTIKEDSKNYEPPVTHNITDLEKVSVELELLDGEGTDKDKNVFKYKYFVLDEKQYRVPLKVLGDIQEILKVKPNLKFVKVTKKGEGIQTTYTVIPLD